MNKFVEKIISLDNIRQWEERDSIIKETVSQHSFKVAAIAAYLISEIEKSYLKKIESESYYQFKSSVLQYAILHDFDEAILGRDISHVVKYNSYNGDEIRKVIDDFVEHQIIPYSNLVNKPKDELEVKFVKLCDWIALLTFIRRNTKLGCLTFKNEENYCLGKMSYVISEVQTLLYNRFNILVNYGDICQEN